MLTLEKIKELATYTDSIKVLQAACNLSNSDIKYVKRIYNILKEESLNITQEFADIIAENYITQRLVNSKIPIEKLVESAEFKQKVQELTKEELLKYMELCNSEKCNDLLYNKVVLATYSAKDHFAIIEMADKVRNKATEIKDIFFAGISNNCPVDTIRIIIKSIDTRLTEINKGEMARLLTSESFYELYSSTDMVEVITRVLSLQDQRDIKVLVNVALSGAWIKGKYAIKFSQVAELVSQTNENNQLLLEKELTYELEYDDIVEMLKITQNAAHLVPLFTNEFVREHLSYEQIVDLIQEFDLSNPESFDTYATALSMIIQTGIKESLYQDLRTSLAKEIYVTTVGEYLSTCNSIAEFIKTIERECKDTDPIGTNTELNLKLK